MLCMTDWCDATLPSDNDSLISPSDRARTTYISGPHVLQIVTFKVSDTVIIDVYISWL
jgi:hypothetical protein